jgi:hypothetical protein
MFPDRTYCVVAYLRQKSKVNFRSTKVDAGNLKCKYLNQPWSTLAAKVLTLPLVANVQLKGETTASM